MKKSIWNDFEIYVCMYIANSTVCVREKFMRISEPLYLLN